MPLLIWGIIILIICIYCCPGFLVMMLTIGAIAIIVTLAVAYIKTRIDDKRFDKAIRKPYQRWND